VISMFETSVSYMKTDIIAEVEAMVPLGIFHLTSYFVSLLAVRLHTGVVHAML
jgi:hypothetical protein